ncbi:hypothetical protein GWP57_02800 [Gammaproteobacteria bacterium]|jgi:hypothetical protein|nr:hypothetical protein [Gammaproteobacteria bacterium]
MPEPKRQAARLLLVLIACLFFGPLLLAAWLYYGGYFSGARQDSSHGALFEPSSNPGAGHAYRAGQRSFRQAEIDGCADSCAQPVFAMKHSLAMPGGETDRLSPVFLRRETLVDTVSAVAERPGMVMIESAGLIDSPDLERRPAEPAGGFYLVDPIGNLAVYFRPGIFRSNTVGHGRRLLRLSRTG